ncbi:hypothetical protein X474_04030 [Dethiosulfatarculus sandiegensis]|uniref:Uncharacterized protein n=1 Tax=Dethiosulfatarculus sandiegensis TaxID=1429043 RepID=A0A0D2JIE5_9BACT|nr:hypothetical protein X474_04030 [Dethiosulfatarculus sandiegensis]
MYSPIFYEAGIGKFPHPTGSMVLTLFGWFDPLDAGHLSFTLPAPVLL